jgi:glutamyl/glutaminyl-tRNA synthetase
MGQAASGVLHAGGPYHRPMPENLDQVVTRFAPSPTGHLHVGGARSALFCWAFAKSQAAQGKDGRFMIRIEDTDQARSSEESARGILEDLAWLGIHWDDGPVLNFQGKTIGGDSRHVAPYFQAQRVATYNAYIEHLMDVGRAYPAFDTSEELEILRKAATAAKQTFKYPRPADVKPGMPSAERLAKARAGTPHVVRFLMDADAVVVQDQVLGDVKIAPGEVDDFVIRKADGFPTYHFAVVIDDELMGVTHVMRAQEHLANTPRHVALQRALTRLDTKQPFRTPQYAHMPLIFNMDATKMSKRDKAKAARKAAKDAIAKNPALTAASLASSTGLDGKLVSDFLAAENDNLDVASKLGKHLNVALPEIEVFDFRASGYLPEAITNFLSLLGWNPGLKTADGKDLEKFDLDFLAKNFSIDRIGRTNAKFDRAKLLSFNADAIGAMSEEAFVSRWLAFLAEHEPAAHTTVAALGHDKQLYLARALKPRAKTFRDALRPIGFLFTTDESYSFDAAAVEKNLKADGGAGLALLREAKAALESIDDSNWKPEQIHGVFEKIAQLHADASGKPAMGPVSQAVRIAVTGSTVSPGLGETLAVLGRTHSLARIDRCIGSI